MGVSNPVETVVGVIALLDDVKAKMVGTSLAGISWRPSSPDCVELIADLVGEAMARCDDVTEALIVVTVASMAAAARER